MALFDRLNNFFGNSRERQAEQSATTFDPLLYSLETPKPQQINWGGNTRFSGWILYFGPRTVTALEVTRSDSLLGSFSVSLPRQDVALHISSLPAAKTCGFDFDLPIQDGDSLVFTVVYEDVSKEKLFCYDLNMLKQQYTRWNAWKEQLADLPQPSSELVFLTQGITNITEYQHSILPAVATMQNYLAISGVPYENFRSILDFGCGSGRLLLGWHIMRPDLSCCGCDINQRLVGWAQRHLPAALRFDVGSLLPPTEYATGSFDLVYAISVFTHLSLPVQQRWIEEFRRILAPGGYLLITLHGPLYAHRAFDETPEMLQAFIRNGYAAVGDEEGSNNLAIFHSRAFAEQLFTGFRLLAQHPQGHVGTERVLFPVAFLQDVYLFQRS